LDCVVEYVRGRELGGAHVYCVLARYCSIADRSILELSVLYSGAKSALRMGRPCVEEASKTRLTDSL
jgi:hypothetical protein